GRGGCGGRTRALRHFVRNSRPALARAPRLAAALRFRREDGQVADPGGGAGDLRRRRGSRLSRPRDARRGAGRARGCSPGPGFVEPGARGGVSAGCTGGNQRRAEVARILTALLAATQSETNTEGTA